MADLVRPGLFNVRNVVGAVAAAAVALAAFFGIRLALSGDEPPPAVVEAPAPAPEPEPPPPTPEPEPPPPEPTLPQTDGVGRSRVHRIRRAADDGHARVARVDRPDECRLRAAERRSIDGGSARRPHQAPGRGGRDGELGQDHRARRAWIPHLDAHARPFAP